jgi:hypothetical protein
MDEKPMSKTLPINITVQSRRKAEQNSLNNIRFDPPQNSPPNSWNKRLNKRAGISATNTFVKVSQNL